MKKGNGITVLLFVLFFVGVGLLLYPSFSNYWNTKHQTKAISEYVEDISNTDEEKNEALWKEAIAYNKMLCETGINWILTEEEKYQEYLKVNDTGLMAYIEIPSIQCSLPIYHGTDEAVLQVGVGHVEGSSLPVGGEGSHCVLSGHRGLPSAKLFTDLDMLVEGDQFMIYTLGKTLTYEVDQISIVEPTDFSKLQIEGDKDYCTLVTCTPYGINTHRLLIRGQRIDK